MLPDKPLNTIEEMATFLQVSNRFAQKLCKSGAVDAVKVGRLWRVNHDSLCRYAGVTAATNAPEVITE